MKIDNNIYVGTSVAADNVEHLLKSGITHIINLGNRDKTYSSVGIPC